LSSTLGVVIASIGDQAPRRLSCVTFFFAYVALAFSFAVPVAVPTTAHAVTINISIGTSLNNGRAITCRDGERILRSRGFWDIRRVDCRGRFFVYRARHLAGRFEVGVAAHNGRVVDLRRLGR
jgi:hypothetical protein